MRAYVEATMRMTADGKHSIASILQQADISPSKYDDIMALHTTLLRPSTPSSVRRASPTPMRTRPSSRAY